MTPEEARNAIAALRHAHDRLAEFALGADGDALGLQSGCSEWTVADVLSHMGSASEIGLNTVRTGTADMGAAPAIWDRWNAMSPQEKAANFVTASGRLVAELESMTDADLDAKKLNLGFLPMPVDIGFYAGMRLTEVALHGWDVDVALDRTAQVDQALVPFVLDRLPGYASFLAKPGDMSGVVGVTVTDPSRAFTLRLAKDGTGLDEGLAADATTRASMPAEAFARLLAGRLAAEHTPASVMVDGRLSLDDLRSVFPGM